MAEVDDQAPRAHPGEAAADARHQGQEAGAARAPRRSARARVKGPASPTPSSPYGARKYRNWVRPGRRSGRPADADEQHADRPRDPPRAARSTLEALGLEVQAEHEERQEPQDPVDVESPGRSSPASRLITTATGTITGHASGGPASAAATSPRRRGTTWASAGRANHSRSSPPTWSEAAARDHQPGEDDVRAPPRA